MEKRTSREIKVPSKDINNENVNIKIGTVENRKKPGTIYIEIDFWIESKNKEQNSSTLRKRIKSQLKEEYKTIASNILKNNNLFPYYDDNLFIIDVPENINYNNKKNFISIQFYLHTLNNKKDNEEDFPLSKNSKLYEEALKLVNHFCQSQILKGEKDFFIYRKK